MVFMPAYGKPNLRSQPLKQHKAMKWIRRFLRSEFVSHAITFLAAQYIRLVFATSKWETVGIDIPESYFQAKKTFILCFWHGRLGMMACSWIWKEHPIHMLLSAHRDGQLIGQTVAHFGIHSIAGSTQRGGMQAFRGLLKTLNQGDIVGITPDGPRGPCQVASLGVITLAKLANVDMVPITFSTSRRLRLNTWDRFHFPLPFGRGVFLWGNPVPPPASNDATDKEITRQLLETDMTTLQDKADQLMGR
jgi:lysophospholipid acyltransferase (LPLAT)-like uncharacterized protein